MSVRRLAADAVQPASFVFTNDNKAWADQQIAKYPVGRQASAVIPLLWKAQEQHDGWLPRAAIEEVARLLEMPGIRVLEVATFYTMFNLEPVGRYFVQLCGTTPCRLRGAEAIIDVCKQKIGPEKHVTADGLFSWMEVECLGACCNAPMVQINYDYYEDLTAESFSALIDGLAAGQSIKPGPQSRRFSSEPEGSPTSLTEASLFDGSLNGKWRSRFEAGAQAAASKTGEAERAAQSAPTNPKPAKPDAGRVTQSDAADTPAKRVSEGEQPVKPAEQSGSANADQKTVAEPKTAGTVPSTPKDSTNKP